MSRRCSFGLLVGLNVLLWCVLSFYQMSTAAPPAGNQPFANAVEQRMETVNQLKDISAQLKELNTFLRSGNLRVVVKGVDKGER